MQQRGAAFTIAAPLPGFRPGSLAQAAEVDDKRDEIDATAGREEAKTTFNGRYLQDVLQVPGTAQAAPEVTGPSSPGVTGPWAATMTSG